MSSGRHGAGLRLGATFAALVAAQTVLWRAGTALPSLPLDGAGILRAFEEAEPLPLAVSLLRLAALAVGAGLLGMTTLGVIARCFGAARLVARVDRWTPRGLRRLLDGALGAGLAASIGLSALPAAGETGGATTPTTATLRRLPDAPPTTIRRLPDDTPATIRRLPDAAPASTTERSPPTLAPPTGSPITLRRLPDGLPAPPMAAPAPPMAAPAPPMAAPAAPVTAAAPSPVVAVPPNREVVVRPGDSFWRLAERHQTDRLGRQPTEAEVGACWQELVAVNRHRLAVRDDVDLLFPGQVLVLPCP